MATSQSNHVCDNSTLANFKDWAMSIGAALAALGWVQANDTGQVVWTATVLTLTQVAVAGGNAVYSYSSYTGPAPRVGMSVTVSGFATGGNNVATKVITAISGGASGTFTLAATTQANETHAGSATTTAVAALPSFSFGYYEIWRSNGAQSASLPIYLKLGYGYGSNNPGLQVTAGTGSSAGNLTGAGSLIQVASTSTPNAGATTYECDFSGDADEFRFILWRNSTKACFFAVERAKDNAGANTDEYFTTVSCPSVSASSTVQETVTRLNGVVAQENRVSCYVCGASSGYFNGTVLADMMRPIVGKWGNPALGVGCCRGTDVAEGATVTVANLYGGTHTYIACKNSTLAGFGAVAPGVVGGTNGAVLMRWE